MNSNTHLTIDLLRHGEPLGGKKYRGQTNDPLTERGWIQMQAMQSQMDLSTVDFVVSSTLSRCAEFAQSYATNHNLPCLIENDWKEVGFGDWEGLTAEEINQQYPGLLKAYYDNPYQNTPPNAEPIADFEQRIFTAWDALIHQSIETQKNHVLLVGHSGVMRTILVKALGISRDATYHLNLPYATWVRLKVFTSTSQPFVQLMHYQTPEG